VPRNAVLWNNCGACLLRLSRRDDAAECFRRALALQPDLADARNNLDQLEKAARSAPPAAR